MKGSISFLLGSVTARGSGRRMLLIPDCSPCASEERTSQGNPFAVL